MTKLIVILGPTASGKTKLAVAVAKRIDGAIISADSRQVYRGMDIGTGKDLSVYEHIPYFLIDIRQAGDRYDVAQYVDDFNRTLDTIRKQGKRPILCGGTGLYIQAALQGLSYTTVPADPNLRMMLERLPLDTLRERLHHLPLPQDYTPDLSTRKRLIRAIEIAEWCRHNPLPKSAHPPVEASVFGLDPPVDVRRTQITNRLQERLDDGLLEEVRGLLQQGISPEQLLYYGLEYKYATLHLTGKLDYNTFFARLNTEIHRYAKRQMTYFRKLEKDGIKIRWLKSGEMDEMTEEVVENSSH
ncbi:tRNA (adenosine(37)-N6)-dimethylallyltransferase MiaA [Parapedobacter sp. DT-150]|uniref:tRNA (adenosine(37)-N6)-dimethylallyltransferase MiaA n=1 Tax=Parapedobacter sp. DT-150 TaxID=3396162 RepID=UPI003F1D2C6B